MSAPNSNVLVGLDINNACIGWSAVRLDHEGNAVHVIGQGVWCFPSPLDPNSGESLLLQRGVARRQRRNRDRKRNRLKQLRDGLIRFGLLPRGEEAQFRLFNDHNRKVGTQRVGRDPYQLRKAALEGPITLHELGRVIYHIAVRRAYLDIGDLPWLKVARQTPHLAPLIREKALKQSQLAVDKKDTERRQVLGGIARLAAQLNGQTPGQYFAGIVAQRGRVRFSKSAKKESEQGFLLSRWMLEEELRLIWEKQATYHQDLQSPHLLNVFCTLVFDQRELLTPRGAFLRNQANDHGGKKAVGPVFRNLRSDCAVYKDHPAAAKASLWFQRFRISQDLANARVLTDSGKEPLTRQQREVLFAYLQGKEKVSPTDAKKVLAASGCPLPAKATLCRSAADEEKVEFVGNLTAIRLREVLGSYWDELAPVERYGESGADKARSERNQVNLVQDLIDEPTRSLFETLQVVWGLDDETCLRVMRTKLPEGYGRYCTRLLRRVAPIMLEHGLDTQAAIDAMRGKPREETGEVLAGSAEKWLRIVEKEEEEQSEVGRYRNHVVARCVREARWLIQQLEREYGKIATVRIEVSRDLSRSAKQRDEIEAEQRKRRKENDALRSELIEAGCKPSKTNLLKLKLLKEQQGCFPMYGPRIALPSVQELCTNEYEVDHVVPRSRGGERGFPDNLVLTTAQLNREKANETPWERWGNGKDPERWAEIERNVRRLGGTTETEGEDKKQRLTPKARRILSQKIEDYVEGKFEDRALADQRYATKEIMAMLRTLKIGVEAVPGRTTSDLRSEFLRLDPFYQSQIPQPVQREMEAEGTTEEEDAKVTRKANKNRDFHYHHAIDALVVALCDRSTLARYYARVQAEELNQLPRADEAQEIVTRSGKKKSLYIGWPKAIYEQLQNGAPKITFGTRPGALFGGSWTKEGPVKIRDLAEKRKQTEAEAKADLLVSMQRYLDEAAKCGKPYRRATPALDGDYLVYFDKTSHGLHPKLILPKDGNHHLTVWKHEKKMLVTVTSDLEVAHRYRMGRSPYDDTPPEVSYEKTLVIHPGDVVELDKPGSYYAVRSVSQGQGFEVQLSHLSVSWVDKRVVSLYEPKEEALFVRIQSVGQIHRIIRRVKVDPFGRATTAKEPQ